MSGWEPELPSRADLENEEGLLFFRGLMFATLAAVIAWIGFVVWMLS